MELVDQPGNKNRETRKILIGVAIIIAGILLLGSNFGLFDNYIRNIIFSWPMLLIVIGVINLLSVRHVIGGVILVLIGGYFLALRIIPVDLGLSAIFWPSILILLGLLIIFKNFFRSSRTKYHGHENFVSDSGFIHENNVFGGRKVRVAPGEFKGGKINNVFGGSEIDLTQTYLPEGQTILQVDAVFGGTTLHVPPDWVVTVKIDAVLGGVSDKRFYRPAVDYDIQKELILKGSVVFGGVEIKN